MQPDLAEEQGHPTNTAPVDKYSAGGVVRSFWGNQNVQIKMRVASAAAPVYIHTHTRSVERPVGNVLLLLRTSSAFSLACKMPATVRCEWRAG